MEKCFSTSGKDWVASSFGNLLKDSVLLLYSEKLSDLNALQSTKNVKKRHDHTLSNSLLSLGCLPCPMSVNVVNPLSSFSNSSIFLLILSKKKKEKRQ